MKPYREMTREELTAELDGLRVEYKKYQKRQKYKKKLQSKLDKKYSEKAEREINKKYDKRLARDKRRIRRSSAL